MMHKIPFSMKEIIQTDDAVALTGGIRKPLGYTTPVTPKENYLSAVRRKGALWFPFTADTLALMPRIIADNLARVLACDLEAPLAEDRMGGPDMFGIEWTYVPEVGGSTVRPGHPVLSNANDWQDRIRFPDLGELDWERYAFVNVGINGTRYSLNATILNGLFERLISFMDFEQAAVALIDGDQEDAVHALFSRLCDLYEEMISRYLACFRLDGIVFHDDWGSQRAPFFSLKTCRKMLMPYVRRICEFCHARGLWFQLHSCGKNEPLVPAMLEAGVDVWIPQEMNDVEGLVQTFGERIVIGVTPVNVPADASGAEVEAAARSVVDKYAPLFPEKPVVIVNNRIDRRLTDKIYEMSRIALYG